MAQRIDTNRNGIQRVTTLKPPSGNRQCIVPWRRDGGGKKSKRIFRSRQAAEFFIDARPKFCANMHAYQCQFHTGWHIGHERKAAVPLLTSPRAAVVPRRASLRSRACSAIVSLIDRVKDRLSDAGESAISSLRDFIHSLRNSGGA